MRSGSASTSSSSTPTCSRASVRSTRVVSNPPYVAADDQLPPEIVHEPREALYGGADGLDVIRRLIAEAAGSPVRRARGGRRAGAGGRGADGGPAGGDRSATSPGMSAWSSGVPDAADLERCIAAGGVAVFPSDTVYGLACDPEDAAAVERLYALKGRATGKPSAVMFFDGALALAALPEVGPRTRALMERLLPGGVTLLLPNPRGRYPLAGGGDARAARARCPRAARCRPADPPELGQRRGRAGRAAARRRTRGDPPRRRPRARRRRAARHPVDA